MRLQFNPLFPENAHLSSVVARQLSARIEDLKLIQESLAKLRSAVDKLGNGNSPEVIQQVFHEIDQVVETTTIHIEGETRKPFSGAISRRFGQVGANSFTTSLWISTGPDPYHRERVYLPTMTSSSLFGGLVISQMVDDSYAAKKSALGQIAYAEDSMKAYILRFGVAQNLAIRLSKVQIESQMHTRPIQTQASLLESTLTYLDSLMSAVSTLKYNLSKQESQVSRAVQIELTLSAMIDEVDRIASQAEFNRMSLLLGDFSEKSRVGSMWFIQSNSRRDPVPIFIATMTAMALGLRMANGAPKDSLLNQQTPSLDSALRKIERERQNILQLSSKFKNAPEMGRQILTQEETEPTTP